MFSESAGDAGDLSGVAEGKSLIDHVFPKGQGKHPPHPPHPPRSHNNESEGRPGGSSSRGDLLEAQVANAESDRLDALEEAECAAEERDGYRLALADARAELRGERNELIETRRQLVAARSCLSSDGERIVRLSADLQSAHAELDAVGRVLDGAGAPPGITLADRLRGLIAQMAAGGSR